MSGQDHLPSTAGSAPIADSDSSLDFRALTPARVALGRTGCSITTRHALEFALAHAQARDAVHAAFDVAWMMAALRERGFAAISVKSAAEDRTVYLRRPDLGRTLAASSAASLAANVREAHQKGGADSDSAAVVATVNVIVAGGLSALAAERHAVPLLDALLPLLGLKAANDMRAAGAPAIPAAGWAMTPVIVAEQGRVALGDEIGGILKADVTVMLIGERPGLSSPDSLGAYITWGPRPGRSDAERNCVSNIRDEGLDYAAAAEKIAWYVNEGRRRGLTGVELREPDRTLLP